MLDRHGEAHRDFSAIIGWKALTDSIAQLGEDHEFTKLIVDLKGKDPDDAFSSIPYEKGFSFLYHLEKLLGKDKWDKFIPHVRSPLVTSWVRPLLANTHMETSTLRSLLVSPSTPMTSNPHFSPSFLQTRQRLRPSPTSTGTSASTLQAFRPNPTSILLL